MGTRGCIARATGPNTFVGVYHHWDSYPDALGKTLYALYNGHFGQDLGVMLKALIDDHPAGWSTINNADFSLPAGFLNPEDFPCKACGKPSWAHYRQEYRPRKVRLPAKAQAGVMVLGHFPDTVRPGNGDPKPPQCYCHGSRSEEANELTEANASECGAEYVYAFEVRGSADEGWHDVMHILSSYCPDGHKMIGMFGMGDPDATWKGIGLVHLRGPEPDWESFTKS